MSKKFAFNAPVPTSANGEGGSNVDFDALNKHIVEAVACAEQPEAMIGIVSGVIDLGLQPQEDAKMVWTGDAASEAAELEKNPNQYFETLPNDKKVPTRYKRWAVKAQRSVALTIDFPETLVNKGQFFDPEGGGEALPYRSLLNNEFGMKGIGKVVGKPYSLREQRNDDGTWSIKNNTILFKLAQATGALQNGMFKPQYLGDLIGKAAMFNVHVFLNEHGGKEYLNEKLSFNGPVPKALQKAIPELAEEHMYLVNFTGEQDEVALKNLRQSVINTMKQAEDFVGSDVEAALIKIGKIKAGEAAAQPKAEPQSKQPSAQQAQAAPRQQAAPAPTPEFDSFDDDLPF